MRWWGGLLLTCMVERMAPVTLDTQALNWLSGRPVKSKNPQSFAPTMIKKSASLNVSGFGYFGKRLSVDASAGVLFQ